MKNFVQPGDVVTVIAPSGGVVSGQGVLVGYLFGVAAFAAAAGASVEIACEGVYTLPKATGALAVGDKLYWDATAGNLTATSSGNKWVAVAAKAALSADATVNAKLNELAV